MINFLRRRGLAAVTGIFMFATAAAPASAAPVGAAAAPASAPVAQAQSAYLGSGQAVRIANAVMTAPVSSPAAAIAQAPLAMAQTLPLAALVAVNSIGAPLDEQGNCVAVAIYHEARGESLEGQLAVANVIMNRARSGRYPSTWCEVVKQPAQFSFVRRGRFPSVDEDSAAWQRAQSIARIAALNIAAEVGPDVLWYHADYVSPSWGKRLTVAEKVGTHIFYRA